MIARKFLERKGLLKIAEKEWKLQPNGVDWKEFNHELDTADSLNGLFIWSKTTQGFSFWNNLETTFINENQKRNARIY